VAWQCVTDPEQVSRVVTRDGGEDTRVGLETGPMTPFMIARRYTYPRREERY
jgi:hypothetical protein